MKSVLFKILKLFKNTITKIGINRHTPGAGRIYDFLIRGLWPYKSIIEIQGSKMYLNIKDKSLCMRKTFEGYALDFVHEKSTTELFKKVVKNGNTVVDLGANIGYFTLLAAKLVGKNGKVFAFEPEPRNYSYLVKNINLNNYTQVVALQKAVSNQNGKTRLYICDYDSGHHTINKYEGVETYSRGRFTEKHSIEIETVTLDSFLAETTDRVDVIKMDIEGAEVLALEGMDKILRKNKKLKIFAEFFPLLIIKMGNSPQEFIRKLLEDCQFSIYVIPDDYDAQKGEMIKINSVKEIMNPCRGEKDHINLFLERDGNNKKNPKEN